MLRIVGLTERQIYQEGRNGETIASCEEAFRGQPGTLVVGVPLNAPRQCGRIKIVGFEKSVYEELTELAETLQKSPTLRRIFAAI